MKKHSFNVFPSPIMVTVSIFRKNRFSFCLYCFFRELLEVMNWKIQFNPVKMDWNITRKSYPLNFVRRVFGFLPLARIKSFFSCVELETWNLNIIIATARTLMLMGKRLTSTTKQLWAIHLSKKFFDTNVTFHCSKLTQQLFT